MSVTFNMEATNRVYCIIQHIRIFKLTKFITHTLLQQAAAWFTVLRYMCKTV